MTQKTAVETVVPQDQATLYERDGWTVLGYREEPGTGRRVADIRKSFEPVAGVDCRAGHVRTITATTHESLYTMTHTDLQQIQNEMCLDARSMAIVCGIPYDTYQSLRHGRRAITEESAGKILAARQRNRETMNSIIRRVHTRVERDFPHGIPSEAD